MLEFDPVSRKKLKQHSIDEIVAKQLNFKMQLHSDQETDLFVLNAVTSDRIEKLYSTNRGFDSKENDLSDRVAEYNALLLLKHQFLTTYLSF